VVKDIDMGKAYKILPGNLKGRDRFEDLGIFERITLKSILKKQGVRIWTGSIWLRIVTSGGLLWTR
jgi:hypothetical protein